MSGGIGIRERPKAMPRAETIARAAWGETIPDWLTALAQACDNLNQRQVADRIGYSTAVVSNVLNRKYAGNLTRVEAAVRDGIMRAGVDCPVLGPIRGDECVGHQRRPFAATNPQRVRLWKTCRSGCPHSRLERKF